MGAGQKSTNWAYFGIIVSWMTFWFFLAAPIGFITWIIVLVYLIAKNRSILIRYCLLSAWILVPMISFVSGTVRYFQGTATLQGVGGPEIIHEVDPETRVRMTSSGCMILGGELFFHAGNNLAVQCCTRLWGYQHGAYTGPYPLYEEVAAMINNMDTVSVDRDGAYYHFFLQGHSFKVMASEIDRWNSYDSLPAHISGKWLGECFLILLENPEGNERSVSLIDATHQTLLNCYTYALP